MARCFNLNGLLQGLMIIKKPFIYVQGLFCSLEQLFNLESSVDCFSMCSGFPNQSKILYS